MIKIALIGRPNVGKSTLFNRIVGKRLALVDDQPGVTRDLREASSKILGVPVTIVDTAGLESAKDGSLSARMRALTERGMKEADILVFLIDARAGVTSLDAELADLVRKSDKPTYLCANKAEGKAGEAGYFDAYTLGLGEPIAISGEHGEGVYELYQAMFPRLEDLQKQFDENKDADEFVDFTENLDDELTEDEAAFQIDPERPIHVAIVGRPNAGKSTLVNAIIGEDRLLTGPEAGITRDSIAIETKWYEQAYKLIDTAGMRKKSRVQDKVEGLSVGDGIRALKFAEVVVVLVDALTPFEQQDLRIADLCEREGRAIVICANKWDLVENKNSRRQEIIEGFERLLPQIKGAPLVTISAKTGKNLERLEAAIREVYEVWNRRIPTGQLNDWLREETQRHPPPAPKGRRIKIKYITQAKTRPPSFVGFCTRAEELPDSYKRFLVNGLRYDFDIPGVPIRLHFKSNKNPYEKKAKARKIH